MGDEADALRDIGSDEEADFYASQFNSEDWEEERHERERTKLIEERKSLYEKAKAAPVGSKITCPVCHTLHKKRHYQEVFCRNKGRGNCKDRYWNLATEKRRARTLLMK